MKFKIIVKVKTRAKKESVERVEQQSFLGEAGMVVYKVSVKEAPVDGKANQAIVRALATYFDVAPSVVRLVVGQTSKQKIFEIH